MPQTVNSAFDTFMRNIVNLEPVDVEGARASRDWLLIQISAVPAQHADFPTLYPDVNIHYGSFARNTKIRELNDVDLIVGLSALGTTYYDAGTAIHLIVPEGIVLRDLCHDGTSLLNSRKVINRFVGGLRDVPQYERSEIKRNGSAAVLNLQSYSWSFDIVPGFFTTPEIDGRTYYIIPDGAGHWMKTDPRVDRDRVSELNQRHGGNVLNAVRLIKYWNQRPTMPTMSSYLLECIVLDYYASNASSAVPWVDLEALSLLDYLSRAVYNSVPDPKRIQGDINTLSADERRAIAARASVDLQKATAARAVEQQDDHRTAIRLWSEVLGTDFPSFG